MPTVTLQPSNADAQVFLGSADTNYGVSGSMSAGVGSSTSIIYRILVKFDISSIPSSAVVTAATLSLFATGGASGADGASVKARRLTSTWVETSVTWNNQPSSTTTDEGTASYPASNQFLDFVVTNIVAGWVSGATSNFGFLVRTNSETATNTRGDYHSREDTNGPTSERPKLVVTYNVPPSAPTPTAPINGAQISGTVANNFTMTATDPEADNLNGYEIEYRLVAGGSTSTGTQSTSTASGGTITHQFAANTFTTPGSWEWRARTRDSGTNTFGAWSSWASFTITAIERWGVIHI